MNRNPIVLVVYYFPTSQSSLQKLPFLQTQFLASVLSKNPNQLLFLYYVFSRFYLLLLQKEYCLNSNKYETIFDGNVSGKQFYFYLDSNLFFKRANCVKSHFISHYNVTYYSVCSIYCHHKAAVPHRTHFYHYVTRDRTQLKFLAPELSTNKTIVCLRLWRVFYILLR